MSCSPVWHPHLMKDITRLEQLQCRATKYILNNYSSDYKTCLIKLQLLPLMYVLELSDIMFFITNTKKLISSFNVNAHISFTNSCTRSNRLKLSHTPSFNNKRHHFYFNRICRLWNSLPIINVDLSTATIKNQIKSNHSSGNILFLILIRPTNVNFTIFVHVVPVSTFFHEL